MDEDDGLMLNFASPSAGSASGGGVAAAGAAKRPKQSAKARFEKKRIAQRATKAGLVASSRSAGPSRTQPAPVATPAQATSQANGATTRTEAFPSPAKRLRTQATSNQTTQDQNASTTSSFSARNTVGFRQSQHLVKSTSSTSSSSVPTTQPAATASRASGPAATPAGGVISALFPSHGVLEDANSIRPSEPHKPKYDPSNAPAAGSDFPSLGLDPLLVYHLSEKLKIGSHPTSIQKAALPHLLHKDLDRDVLIQAQTGSGKTLTYLLPILQSLLPLCEESFIDRSVGTLAIILAPTRELARQIYEVLEKLVSLSLSLKEQSSDAETSTIRRTRWLVPGLLSGGSTKNHEKQRLRKGCPILVSTPGRLLDHLQNTSSFDVGKCRWLILDEADRLLEMGFEEQLTGIVKALDGRRKLACTAAREAMPGFVPDLSPEDPDFIRDENVMDTLGMNWWSYPRRVVLCSATLDENVQILAGKTLTKPLILRAGKDDGKTSQDGQNKNEHGNDQQLALQNKGKFAAPAQLQQNFIVAPPKLRLVTLLALLRGYISRAKRLAKAESSAYEAGNKILEAGVGKVIVFMSCTDSVDFHFAAFGGAKMNAEDNVAPEDQEANGEDGDGAKQPTCRMSELIPGIPIFRLHGSMTQQERIASLRGFAGSGGGSTKKKADSVRPDSTNQASEFQGSILLCTSVASRGLDLPNVGCVVQLDPPTEGGIEEYLHRVGRTARVGKKGESWLMILPQELGWVDNVLEANMTIQSSTSSNGVPVSSIESKNSGDTKKIAQASIEHVLQQGFGGSPGTLEYQSRATEVQLAFERWVIQTGERSSLLARRAFLSHVRAYATHSADEKQYFNVRALHLGHLAKAFALREAPRSLGKQSASIASIPRQTATSAENSKSNKRGRKHDSDSDSDTDKDDDDDGGSDYESSRRPGKADSFELDKAALTKLTESIITSGSGSKDLLKEALKAAKKTAGKSQGTSNGADGGKEKTKQTDAEARMYAKVRELGRGTRKDGKLGAYGTDEFQIA